MKDQILALLSKATPQELEMILRYVHAVLDKE